ncbi:MAG: FKBP-type peptidyl-prolyl cis-trans isomerase [Acidimicrobiales bacterium]
MHAVSRAGVVTFAIALFAASCSSGTTADIADSTTSITTGVVDSTAAPTTEPAAVEGKPEVDIPDGPAPVELEIDDLIVGDGEAAAAGDYLVMNYVGVRHADGVQFDASWDRGDTFEFFLGGGQVIQGWDQGIEGMREGGRRQLSIPADLAYGDQARGELIPAGSPLVFVVDLVRAVSPPDVANVPEPVTVLDVEVLTEGSGAEIEPGDQIEVHYVAILQTTGEMFASTWVSGQPQRLVVGVEPTQTIAGWDQGLIGTHVGDHVRIVIPPDLGVGDNGGGIPADATIVTELHILDRVPGATR